MWVCFLCPSGNKACKRFHFLPLVFCALLGKWKLTPHIAPQLAKPWSNSPPTLILKLCCHGSIFWREVQIKHTKKEEEIYFRKLEGVCGVTGVVAFYCLRTRPTTLNQLSLSLQYHSVAGRLGAAIATSSTGPKKCTHKTVYKQLAICLQNNNLQPFRNNVSLHWFRTKHLVFLCTARLSVFEQARGQEEIKKIILRKKTCSGAMKKDNFKSEKYFMYEV